MRIILLYTLIFGSVPLIVVQPYFGALVWAWISYMAPHKFTWGAAYYYPFAQIIAIATIGAWLLSREPKRLPLTGITGVFLLLATWVSITTFFALAPVAAERQWEEVIKIFAMVLITYLLIQSKRRIFWLMFVIVMSIGFFGVKGGVFVLMTGGQYRVLGPPAGGLEANNAIGLALVMLIPLIRFIQLEVESLAFKWMLSLSIILSGLSVLASYSRGAFLALIAVGAFLVLRSRYAVLVTSVLVGGLVLGYSFMPEKWVSRIESMQDYRSDLSAMSRLRMWGYGWSVATERPVLGGGFGIYPATERYPEFGFALCEPGVSDETTANCTMKGRSAHNIFMEVVGEHGFVGLVLFVLLGLLAFRTAGWLQRVPPDRADLTWARNLGRMIQVSMVGYLVGGMFMDKAYFDLYYHLVIIVAAAATVVKRELSGEPMAPRAAMRGASAPAFKPLEKVDY